MKCRKLISGRLDVNNDANQILKISVQPNDSLEKYTSELYIPEKDELVSIIMQPNPYAKNGYLWDVAYPEIQWSL